MSDRETIIHVLAHALAMSRWEKSALKASCVYVCGKRRWIDAFAARLSERFPGPIRPRRAALDAFIRQDAGFARARFGTQAVALPTLPDAAMHSGLPFVVDIPALCTTQQLAEWLNISISRLDALADLRQFARRVRQESLSNYRYRMLAKANGAARIIESPKPRLKAIQRRILREILDRIPAHDSAHGFRRERSIVTFTAAHVGCKVVARVDLTDFFPSIRRARVAALFRTVGYPEMVAELLAGLCTTVTPSAKLAAMIQPLLLEQRRSLETLYGLPHLPQGAPTSPAIANLCAYRLDSRLFALATAAGGQYTRYADDLAFSGGDDFARHIKRFLVHVTATVAEEGFYVHHRKTRIMREGVRQHLAGVVVNKRQNIRRREFDRLKATLVNCQNFGPASQNRESHPEFRAHLEGRIAFVAQLNPDRGSRLRKLFNEIRW